MHIPADVPAEIALMGISPQVNNCVVGCYTNYAELKDEYEQIKDELNTCFIDNQAYEKSLKLLEKQKVWFQKNELAYEEKISVLKRDLKVMTNEFKHVERENTRILLENKALKDKLDGEVTRHEEWMMSGKKLSTLLYGSQSVNSSVGLGFQKYVGLEARNDTSKIYTSKISFLCKRR